MENNIQKIKIFLASSYELSDERVELEKAISRKNKIWSEYDIQLELEIWEDCIGSASWGRSQDEYNEEIRKCDFFVVLYFSKVGKYTKEEFEFARKLYQKTNKPCLFIFQKNGLIPVGKDLNGAKSLEDFKAHLKSLDLFPNEYNDIGGLKFDLLDKIEKQLRADGFFKKNDSQALKNISRFPKELTALVKIKQKDIVGREDDLKNLRESLVKNQDTVLVNGMGGIGKTTLAAVYVNEFYEEYDHIVWFTVENNLEQTIMTDRSLHYNLKIENIDTKEQVDVCLNKLRILESEKPKLLVIDNAHESLAKYYDKLPQAPNWHLLVTSRESISHFKEIKLGFLPEEDAIVLFKKYHKNFKDEEISTIVRSIELHTLTIELLAKSATKNHWDLEFVQKALSIDAKSGVRINHSVDEIDRIKSYLISIFDISDLSDNEKYLLKQFTALPNQFVDYKFLIELLQIDELEWKDEFGYTLESLCDKGFILKEHDDINKRDSYKMHPILVEVILPTLKPKFIDLKLLIASVTLNLTVDDTKDNPIEKCQFIPFGEILSGFKLENCYDEITLLNNHLALRYRDVGAFEKGRDLLKITLEEDIKTVGKNHPNVAIRQSDLALMYDNLGEYLQAKELLELALISDKKNFGENHPQVAKRQANLATVCQNLGDFEKAKELLLLALASYIKNFGKNHPYVARCQNNLAMVYQDLGEFEMAKDLMEIVFETNRKYFGKDHPIIAINQNNLAIAYKNVGDFKKSKELHELALESDRKNFGDNHPNVALGLSNLADSYQVLGDLDEAKELLRTALDSFINNFGNYHPDVARCQANLASIYKDLGDLSSAIKLWKKSYYIRLAVLGEKHPLTKRTKESFEKFASKGGFRLKTNKAKLKKNKLKKKSKKKK